MIERDICIGCGRCAEDCVKGLIHMMDGKAFIKEGSCLGCGHCVAVCPVKAVRLPGDRASDIIEYRPESFDLPPANLLNAMRFRRSIRRFKPEPVPERLMGLLLEAARCAPTGANLQSSRYIILRDRLPRVRGEMLRVLDHAARHMADYPQLTVLTPYRHKWIEMYEALRSCGEDHLFHGAPCVLLTVSRDPERCTGELDAGLASAYVELMAHTLGLGCCFIGFATMALRAEPSVGGLLGLAENETLISAQALGIPDVRYYRTVSRRPAEYTTL